jgi:PTH1 family peptidyl-tRNA hydrolase
MGFEVVDALAECWNVRLDRRRFHARIGQSNVAGKNVILLKPCTYMNNSGLSVSQAVNFYQVDPQHLMVVVDDMDLEPGRIRIRSGGSAGGHHGLEDIIARLGTDHFCSCSIGIGFDRRMDGATYVLSRPTPEERQLLDQAVVRSCQAIEYWLGYGLEKAMTYFNRSDG